MPFDPWAQLRERLAEMEAAGIYWLPNLQAKLPGPSTSERSAGARQIEETQSTPTPPPREDRQIALDMLREQVSRCTRCGELAVSRTQTVFGVGPLSPEILFLGEAPGADEDRQGEPFVGAAGQMLNRIIAGSGLRREEIYICNVLRCRPPGNRQPKDEEARNCREYLEGTIDLVAPRVIVCWGAVASQSLLRSTAPLSRLRGAWHDFRGIPVRCTFHPASLLEGRAPQNKKFVWEDMKVLLAFLGRPIPGRKTTESP